MSSQVAQKTTGRRNPGLSKREIISALIVLAVIIGVLAAAFVFRKDLAVLNALSRYGLVGVLLVSFIACSPISVTAVPIPYLLVIFTLPGIISRDWGLLAPLLVGATAAIGATLGQAPTFAIGYGSVNISERLIARVNERAYARAQSWIKKYGSVVVFTVSAIPNPLHLAVTVALGAARFSPRRWVVLSLSGNLVKCLAIAFAGYYGVSSISGLLGS